MFDVCVCVCTGSISMNERVGEYVDINRLYSLKTKTKTTILSSFCELKSFKHKILFSYSMNFTSHGQIKTPQDTLEMESKRGALSRK